MKVRVEVTSLNADGKEQHRQILTIERRELAMETLGVNLTEDKDVRIKQKKILLKESGSRYCRSTKTRSADDGRWTRGTKS
jgi:hypothetical protein